MCDRWVECRSCRGKPASPHAPVQGGVELRGDEMRALGLCVACVVVVGKAGEA